MLNKCLLGHERQWDTVDMISRALPPPQTAHILCRYHRQQLYSRKRPSIRTFLRQLRRRWTFFSRIFRTLTAFSSKQSTCPKDILELEVFLPYTILFLYLGYTREGKCLIMFGWNWNVRVSWMSIQWIWQLRAGIHY